MSHVQEMILIKIFNLKRQNIFSHVDILLKLLGNKHQHLQLKDIIGHDKNRDVATAKRL